MAHANFRYAILTALLLIAATIVPFDSTSALDPALAKKQSDDIASSIMSPYCPGRLLRDCPSGQAAELKEKITTRLEAGESETAIIDSLVTMFGESLRAAPKKEGFGLVAWVAPGAFLLLGGLLIFFWLKSRTQEISKPASQLSEGDRKRIDSELGSL